MFSETTEVRNAVYMRPDRRQSGLKILSAPGR